MLWFFLEKDRFEDCEKPMKFKLISIAALMLAYFPAHAKCEKLFGKWSDQLRTKTSVNIEYATCKVWPANKNLTIAVLPMPHEENNDEMGVYDLVVLVADSMTGKILAAIYQPSSISYDAMRLLGIAIDTAPYQLTANNRAFGVRVTYSGPSKISPFTTTAMTLFLMSDLALRPVLNNFIVEESSGDWDGICTGEFQSTSRKLVIGAIGSEGFAKLKVSEKITITFRNLSGAECVDRENSLVRSNTTLDYRNKLYKAPKRLTLNF